MAVWKKNLESPIWGKEVHLKPTFPVLILCPKQSHFFSLGFTYSFVIYGHAHNLSCSQRVQNKHWFLLLLYYLQFKITLHLPPKTLFYRWPFDVSARCTLSPQESRTYVMWAGKTIHLTFPKSVESNVLSVIENIFLQANRANKLKKLYGSTRPHFSGF